MRYVDFLWDKKCKNQILTNFDWILEYMQYKFCTKKVSVDIVQDCLGNMLPWIVTMGMDHTDMEGVALCISIEYCVKFMILLHF